MLSQLPLITTVLAFAVTNGVQQNDPTVVRTAQGKVRGNRLETYTGKEIFAFRGVRYAESPTGDYRFKPPVPVKPWGEEVRDALEDGPICPQSYADEIGPIVSEDCLFLNVYTKELSQSARQPVMMFLHPGGYAEVTGNSEWGGPQYLLDKDVVFVNINYRLGALGFVSTNDSILPGNYGIKDQVEALKWVQQNIEAFGGDPNRVTLFGYSAGGASVLLHLVSPLSKGLFHRAIVMSGSFTSGWAMNRYPKDLASRLAHNLGCPTTESALIYSCLMRHSAEEIVNATALIMDFPFHPIALFAPVVESDSDNSFLPSDPLDLIRSGQFAKMPIIAGVTRDEFKVRGYYVLENETLTEEFNQKFETWAPIEFMYERGGETSKKCTAAIKKFYLNDKPISNRTRTEFMKIYTDSMVTFSVVQTTQLLAAKSSLPVYMYLFDYSGRLSASYIPGTQTPLGISHHDDLIYLMYVSKLFPEFDTTDPDARMVHTLTSIWTNFASTGVPAIPGNTTEWKPFRGDQNRYLKIDIPPKMESGVPFPDRMAFWESQFPLTGPRQELY